MKTLRVKFEVGREEIERATSELLEEAADEATRMPKRAAVIERVRRELHQHGCNGRPPGVDTRTEAGRLVAQILFPEVYFG